MIFLDQPPFPGAWIIGAQAALDSLSEMTTLDEVTQTFGTARALVEAILGTPVAGGAGTRRSIRATGVLLTHRLGPALAAEALSWAASVIDVVSASTIEAFLETAADSEVTRRPVRLADRHLLAHNISHSTSESVRRLALDMQWTSRQHDIWDPEVIWDLDWGPSVDWNDNFNEVMAWFFEASTVTPDCQQGPPEPTSADVFGAAIAEQAATFDLLSPAERAAVAADPRLFDLAPTVIERCVLGCTAAVLTNPARPEGLCDRVRHPYDAATLELAIRAGAPHFEVARVRRLLADLDDESHDEFMARLPLPYLNARQACGLNTLEALTIGRLAGLDLSDQATANAALGTHNDWRWHRMPPDVADVLIHHRQAADLTWMLRGYNTGIIRPEIAHRIAREAQPAIARLALQFLSPEELTADDAEAALKAGDYWAARCPGIAGSERPPLTISVAHKQYPEAEVLNPYSLASSIPKGRDRKKPFNYPEAIEALQRPYPIAPGWTVRLPETPAALSDNASRMHNCTSGYVGAINAGWTYVVIIESPDGQLFNAAIERRGTATVPRYRVCEVNSKANVGERPDWIEPALNARLAAGAPPEPAEPPVRVRKARQRRRARNQHRRRH